MTPEELANLAHLRRARDLMDREYARPLDVPALAQAALMSPAHFSRQFKAAYGESPYSYLMTRRIERAKALLRRGDMSVTDVCMEVGLYLARLVQLTVHRAGGRDADGLPRPRPQRRCCRAGMRSQGPQQTEQERRSTPHRHDLALPA